MRSGVRRKNSADFSSALFLFKLESAAHLVEQGAIVFDVGWVHQHDLIDDFHGALFVAFFEQNFAELVESGDGFAHPPRALQEGSESAF